MARVFNVLFVVAILCGVVLLVNRTSKLNVLRAEHARLSAEFGVLDVRDPSKFLVTRIETDDPMHFLWRCYYPAGLRVNERYGFGSTGKGGVSSRSDAGEYVHRIRFEMRPDQVRAHLADRGGSGTHGVMSAELVEFLKEHWSELDVQVLAAEWYGRN